MDSLGHHSLQDRSDELPHNNKTRTTVSDLYAATHYLLHSNRSLLLFKDRLLLERCHKRECCMQTVIRCELFRISK